MRLVTHEGDFVRRVCTLQLSGRESRGREFCRIP